MLLSQIAMPEVHVNVTPAGPSKAGPKDSDADKDCLSESSPCY